MIRCFLHDLPDGMVAFATRSDDGDVAIIADRAVMDAGTSDYRWAVHNAILAALEDLPAPSIMAPPAEPVRHAVIHLNDFRPSQSPTVRAI